MPCTGVIWKEPVFLFTEHFLEIYHRAMASSHQNLPSGHDVLGSNILDYLSSSALAESGILDPLHFVYYPENDFYVPVTQLLQDSYERKYRFRTWFGLIGSNLVVLSCKQCSSIYQISFQTYFLTPKKLYVHNLFCSSRSRNDCDMIGIASRLWANFGGPMHKI